MAPETINSTAVLITAIGSAIAAIGTVAVAVMVQLQRKTLGQVEKQGNSVSLELKRINSVYARRAAVATKDPSDEAIADEAETLYNAAKEQAEPTNDHPIRDRTYIQHP